ncbi:Rha family transcriptional regulator [Xenorhabdus bovienii]|uniref:Rha family transcriptional regulator n=1 Tax=Xenorhabdus bovienii TaxID=40576 RepID=A0AAJ1N205_XENBV|nr:DNA-binding protein [Xenorhabdus bovienii]MDE1477596.1 Rha family transcriptional regulator [Xenorhabdus bovienii]MDE9509337.1 Rha family transcriptional regulator [Xenorhabdus bovienii]MDE9520982.1 Rha family transcriptional regulator [Xenorhabdus bovienii]
MQNVTFLALSNESENINQPMMSSREIAELTGKRISAVHSDIRAMVPALYAADNGEKVRSYAWGTTKDEMISFLDHHKIQGVNPVFDDRGYVYEFLLDRRHTEILVTGYDVKRRAAVIDRWFALESGEEKPIIQKSQFSENEVRVLPQNYIEALEALLISEKGKTKLTEERDEAVRTKAQISQKREATALQRNSAYQRVANRAIREREEMASRFGANKEWASQQAVWRSTGIMYGWKVLNAWLDKHEIYDPVTDGYPTSYNVYQNCHEVIYPRQAWLEVHGVDIAELF